jgi:hypothetical protein
MPPDDSDEDDARELDAEEAAPGEGAVLDPDELDFSRDRRVAAIDDNRYVVSPTDKRPNVPETDAADPAEESPPVEDAVPASDTGDPRDDAPRGDVGASLSASEHDYGFEAAAQFEGDVRRERVVSDDVTEAFEALLSWYARGTSEETPRRDVVGILLADSDLPVRLPASAVEGAVRAYDVSPDDSVADLLAAIRASGGLELDGGNHD